MKQVFAISLLLATAIGQQAVAQTKIKDGTVSATSSLPNTNAILELESASKGLLLPRVALTATNAASPLAAHVAGIVVYNSATAGTAPNDVTPGFYYNDGAKWVKLGAAIEPWMAATTTTQASLNTQNIYQNGRVGIGDFSAVAPNSTLQVNGSVSAKIRTISSGTVADDDYTLLVTGNISLPAAASTNTGRIYHLINDTNSNPTVSATFRINGSQSAFAYGLNTSNGGRSVTVQSTGSAWVVISSY